tara:strand:- start:835 stop:1440 length:606 start_codon:yes stop_codon:yes gene_type:complete
MSSLIMGRQRRGKLELSTINDISKIVSTEAIYPLGYEATVPGTGLSPSGTHPSASNVAPTNELPQTWVYVYVDGANYGIGSPLVHERRFPVATGEWGCAAFSVTNIPNSDAFTAVVGLGQHSIPPGNYGFILRKGRGVAAFDGGATAVAGDLLAIDSLNAGKCVTVAAGALTNIEGGFGIVLRQQTNVANFLTDVYVNCVG